MFLNLLICLHLAFQAPENTFAYIDFPEHSRALPRDVLILDLLIPGLVKNPGYIVSITGFAGPAEKARDDRLDLKRAHAVADYLIRGGVREQNIETHRGNHQLEPGSAEALFIERRARLGLLDQTGQFIDLEQFVQNSHRPAERFELTPGESRTSRGHVNTEKGAAVEGDSSLWSPRLVLYLSVGIAAFALLYFLMLSNTLKQLKQGSGEDTVRAFVIPLIIFGALFLIVTGYSDQQIAPVFALMGTIAGYMLGKPGTKTSKSDSHRL